MAAIDSANMDGFFSDIFADDAIWTPAAGGGPYTIQVIFDDTYTEPQIGDAHPSAATLECMARQDQINQGAGMKRNDTLVFGAVTYKVSEVRVADPGTALLLLRK